jgi:hypothetical protein
MLTSPNGFSFRRISRRSGSGVKSGQARAGRPVPGRKTGRSAGRLRLGEATALQTMLDIGFAVAAGVALKLRLPIRLMDKNDLRRGPGAQAELSYRRRD